MGGKFGEGNCIFIQFLLPKERLRFFPLSCQLVFTQKEKFSGRSQQLPETEVSQRWREIAIDGGMRRCSVKTWIDND